MQGSSPAEENIGAAAAKAKESSGTGKLKLWCWKQCGYVVYCEESPYACSICKAKRKILGQVPGGTAFQ
jgi:rubrerythrin